MSLDPVVGALLLGAFALLFGSASVHKWHDLRRFDEVFAAYGLLPRVLRPMARAVPVLESATALGLLMPATHRPAALGAMLLLLGYAAAMALNLARGRRDIACGCGGPDERRPIAPFMVGRNCVLAALLGMTLLPWRSRVLQATDWATVAFGIAAATIVYLCADRLTQLVRQSRALRGLT